MFKNTSQTEKTILYFELYMLLIFGVFQILNFTISWIECMNHEIYKKNCVNFPKSRSQGKLFH